MAKEATFIGNPEDGLQIAETQEDFDKAKAMAKERADALRDWDKEFGTGEHAFYKK